MHVGTLIERVRSEVLDDKIEPYLWSDTNLINYLNDTIDELMEDNLVVVDQSTEVITELKIPCNQTLHDIDDRILKVRAVRSTENPTTPIYIRTEDWMDGNINDWRSITGSSINYFIPYAEEGKASVYPKYDDTYEFTGSSDISFTASTKIISQTGGDFSSLAEDDEIYIDGTTDNDGYFTVVTVGTTSFTVDETVVDESDTSATIRKVMDTLILRVNRTPVTAYTVGDISDETNITILKSVHHPKLMNGMAKRAYLKPDSETYDRGKSKEHERQFEIDKRRMRRGIINFHKPDRTRTIKSGTGIYY